ncbi:MAG: hypothetical protein LBH97_06635, partial [Treponema sp.]|nr:hypothetical protein [Treponema sp.]
MKLRIKLSLMVILLITAIIAILSVFTLTRSSGLIVHEAEEYVMQIAETYAVSLEKRFESYIRPAMTVAEVFGEYHTIQVDERRTQFDNTLKSIMTWNEDYVGMWTAWQPNALDGLDARHGPYNTTFTRKNGPIEKLDEGFDGWQSYLSNLINSSFNGAISDPEWRIVGGKEVPVI